MSLTSALSVALSGLNSSSGLINIASSNIANAQTPGYTTKTANITSLEYGLQAGGSTVTGYTRNVDQVLTENLNAATSQSSYYSTQNSYMTQVQSVLGSTSTNPPLSNDIAQFASAWSEYSANPESTVVQQNVIDAGNTLAHDINTVTTGVATLNSQVNADIQNGVTSLNSALKNIATLNGEVQTATAAGQSTGDLQDQLDQAVNTVASYTNVVIQPRANGQIAVYTSTGQPLVDAGFASQYSYSGSAILDANGNNVTSSLAGGSLQAQVDFVGTSAGDASSTTPGVGIITKLQSQLSTLANAFTGSQASTTSAFATAYSSAVTTSTASTGTQNGVNVASTFFTVTNGSNGAPDPSTFQVNASLLNGSAVLPQMSTTNVASSFDSTATYTASGLTATNVTYAQLGASVLSSFQQVASNIQTQNTGASSLQSYYKTQLTNTTGVNLDQQLANLTMYQNSYAASAHIISTINAMLTTLMQAVG